MDAATLDGTIGELQSRLEGRYLRRPRGRAPHAVSFEISGEGDGQLWLDAERGSAGCYLLPRARIEELSVEPRPLPGRTRQALLLLRKHVDGRRLSTLRRVPGERHLVLEGKGFALSLRFSNPSPVLTLALEGEAVATLGAGPPAWPPPAGAPELEWTRVDLEELLAGAAGGLERPATAVGALLARCPGLGPTLARELLRRPASAPAIRAGLESPRPTLLLAAPFETASDAELAPPHAPQLAPLPLAGRAAWHGETWLETGCAFLVATERGRRFARWRRAELESAGRERRRLEQLELNLSGDGAALPDPAQLRRSAEALLASPRIPVTLASLDVPDPYREGATIEVAVDPRLDLAANADRLFARARRIERARVQIGERLESARFELERARVREERALGARRLEELPAPPGVASPGRLDVSGGGIRHYLSSRGLSIWVGRGARENHELTFRRSRPEDLWFHARNVPGAHVVMRDAEGRAGAADLREAAELAAFFSEAGRAGPVDVHVTRRKHVRAVKGSPGRVQISFSDNLRVAPRDPEGRLRRR
jgi:hypothetical protein